MEWKSLSKEEAMRSPYYGLKGWLLVFYVLTALGIVSYLLLVISPPTSGSGDVGMTNVFLLIHVALSVPFLILAPMKHPLTPKVVIICLWMSFASYLGQCILPLSHLHRALPDIFLQSTSSALSALAWWRR